MIRTRSQLHYIWCLIGMAVLCGCGRRGPAPPKIDWQEVEQIRVGLSAGVEADAGSPAETAQPTGFATLRGRVSFQGTVPAPTTLTIDKDAAVCAPGGKTVYANDLVVDSSTQGLANVVIYLDKIPQEWCHESAQPGKTDEIIFDQKECVFLTHVVAIQTSQHLKVLNSDPIAHNLQVSSFNQNIPSGGHAIYQPLKEERAPVPMSCSVHPWMRAHMLTRDNSYFAVTSTDGSFEIPNLPAGVPLVFRVWHEKGQLKTVEINDPAKWSSGKFSVTLDPDGDVDLQMVVDSSNF